MRIYLKWFVWGAVLALLVFAVVSLSSRAAPPKSALAQGAPISAKDLSDAGFAAPVVQPPSGSRFAGPVHYFRVKESANDQSWAADGAANVVAVDIIPTPWSKTAVVSENALNDISGRASVCGSRVGMYFCVIGPDPKKSEALINILKSK